MCIFFWEGKGAKKILSNWKRKESKKKKGGAF